MANRLYNQCRLYTVSHRLNSLDLCETIDSWIDDGLLPSFEHCFLPYRDDLAASTEEDIFNNDVDAINYGCGIVGYMEGGTFDSGCAWEIGYGYAKGFKIHLVSTEVNQWAAGGSSEFYPVSKVAQYISRTVYLPDLDFTIPDYRTRNLALLQRAWDSLRIMLIEDYANGFTPVPIQPLPVEYDFYIDPNFMYQEPSQRVLDDITAAIDAAGKKYIIGDNMNDIGEDIDNLRRSGQAIFYSDVFEPNVDSGFMHGIAYGIGRPPLVYCSKKMRYQTAFAINYLNVMEQYSAEDVVHSFDELLPYIDR